MMVYKTKIYPGQLFIQLFSSNFFVIIFFIHFRVSLCSKPKSQLNSEQLIIHIGMLAILMCTLLFQVPTFSLSAMIFCSPALPLQLLAPSRLECKCTMEEGCKKPSMMPQILKCLCSWNITKCGTPFLWCKYLCYVHKCYFQICYF
jgi:hypothetical protein